MVSQSGQKEKWRGMDRKSILVVGGLERVVGEGEAFGRGAGKKELVVITAPIGFMYRNKLNQSQKQVHLKFLFYNFKNPNLPIECFKQFFHLVKDFLLFFCFYFRAIIRPQK